MIEHYWQTVPGWFHAEDLYRRMVANAKPYDAFVEVGSWKGKSASFMAVEIANSGKKIQFWCVDTWKGSPELMDDPDVVAGRLHEVFLKNIEPVKEYVIDFKEESVKAASIVEGPQCDFVYIDADHSYESVKADIEAWLPKVRVGGVLAGDDRTAGGVAQALAELLPEHEIDGLNWVWVKK